MEITSVELPKYSKADNSSIDCMITFGNGKTYPFTATSVDNEPHGIELWNDLNAGKYGAISPYVDA